MRRFALMLALLCFTTLASSAAAQDTTRRDSLRQDSVRRDTTHLRVHKRVPVTSRGEVDTAKIKPPSRRDSSLARQEMRVDTASVARDSGAKPDTQVKKKPPPRA